jgi:membrane-bound metal-dependent hydrolase YbcI (DUF457 family)
MLIGHYAAALALQRVRPSIPLWALFAATQAVDVLWDVFILTGVEHARIVPGFTESNPLDLYDMPYSHSVVATLCWSMIFALLWRLYRGARTPSEWWIVALAVGSHFVGDLVVHVRDLPWLGTNGAKLGFGLWRHRELALLVEASSFVGAAWYWRRSPSARGFWTTLTLSVMTIVLVASFYLPAPPSPKLIALTALAIYVAAALAIGWSVRRDARAT